MIATSIIALLVFLVLALSILFFPHFQFADLGRHHHHHFSIKIDTYWIITLVGAFILVLVAQTPLQNIASSFISDTAINPLKILALFFSMTFLSIFLDEVGLFRFLAKKAVSIAKTNQLSLFLILYLLTSFLTVFTSNDVVILTLTPFICFFCKNTKINPIPYLVSEFAAANTWSMMFIIGNPTNIYLGTSAGIDFISYFKVMAVPTVMAGLVELAIIYFIFRKDLKKTLEPQEDDYQIESKIDLFAGVTVLSVCLIFLVISNYIGIEMYLVSTICALFLLVFIIILRLIQKKNWGYLTNSVKRLPYQLIFFVLSMFMIVVCLRYVGISEKFAEVLGDQNVIWTYGFSSFLTANLMNNIPMSIFYSTIPGGLTGPTYLQAIYATIIGSNIGAFLTPVGALAGIMFTQLVEQNEIKYRFLDFVKYGAIIAIPTITVALAGLLLMLH